MPTQRPDRQGAHRAAFEKNRKRLLREGGCCGICGQPVDTTIKDYMLPLAPVIDHIIPVARGGHPSDISNLQLAHRCCNRQKSDKLIDLKALFQREADKADINALPLHYDWANYKATD